MNKKFKIKILFFKKRKQRDNLKSKLYNKQHRTDILLNWSFFWILISLTVTLTSISNVASNNIAEFDNVKLVNNTSEILIYTTTSCRRSVCQFSLEQIQLLHDYFHLFL